MEMEKQKRKELLNNILYATKSISDFQGKMVGGIDNSYWTKKEKEHDNQGGHYYFKYNIYPKNNDGDYYKLKIQKRNGLFFTNYVLYFEKYSILPRVGGDSITFLSSSDSDLKPILKEIWDVFDNRNTFKIEEEKNIKLTTYNEEIKKTIDKKFVRDDKLDELLNDHK